MISVEVVEKDERGSENAATNDVRSVSVRTAKDQHANPAMLRASPTPCVMLFASSSIINRCGSAVAMAFFFLFSYIRAQLSMRLLTAGVMWAVLFRHHIARRTRAPLQASGIRRPSRRARADSFATVDIFELYGFAPAVRATRRARIASIHSAPESVSLFFVMADQSAIRDLSCFSEHASTTPADLLPGRIKKRYMLFGAALSFEVYGRRSGGLSSDPSIRPRFLVSPIAEASFENTRELPPNRARIARPSVASARLRARLSARALKQVKIFSRLASLDPTHRSRKFLKATTFNPQSCAKHSARKVLPVPTGPEMRMPMGASSVMPSRMVFAIELRYSFALAIPPTESSP